MPSAQGGFAREISSLPCFQPRGNELNSTRLRFGHNCCCRGSARPRARPRNAGRGRRSQRRDGCCACQAGFAERSRQDRRRDRRCRQGQELEQEQELEQQALEQQEGRGRRAPTGSGTSGPTMAPWSVAWRLERSWARPHIRLHHRRRIPAGTGPTRRGRKATGIIANSTRAQRL